MQKGVLSSWKQLSSTPPSTFPRRPTSRPPTERPRSARSPPPPASPARRRASPARPPGVVKTSSPGKTQEKRGEKNTKTGSISKKTRKSNTKKRRDTKNMTQKIIKITPRNKAPPASTSRCPPAPPSSALGAPSPASPGAAPRQRPRRGRRRAADRAWLAPCEAAGIKIVLLQSKVALGNFKLHGVISMVLVHSEGKFWNVSICS